MKFTLEIELGNDAMQDAWDICEAMRNLPIKSSSIQKRDSGKVFDRNGNSVGKWEFSESE